MSDEKITAFQCDHIGVSGTTQIFVLEAGGRFEARVGVAIMGKANLPDEVLEKANPFDESFHDNYCVGIGSTQEEALEDLKRDMKAMAASLWG